MPILIRILGITALILCVIPFQFKHHKQIVLCKMVSELLFATQYFLIGPSAYTGACLDLISGGRNYLFYKLVEKKKSTLQVILVFSAFMSGLGIITWASWLSLLPVCAKVISTVSYGMKREKLLRFITLPSCVLWVIYNISVGGWEAAIGDSLSICSILIGIWKFDIRPKAKTQ